MNNTPLNRVAIKVCNINNLDLADLRRSNQKSDIVKARVDIVKLAFHKGVSIDSLALYFNMSCNHVQRMINKPDKIKIKRFARRKK